MTSGMETLSARIFHGIIELGKNPNTEGYMYHLMPGNLSRLSFSWTIFRKKYNMNKAMIQSFPGKPFSQLKRITIISELESVQDNCFGLFEDVQGLNMEPQL